jgi:hypothetical protein
MRILRDSTEPSAIPLGGLDMVGGYVTGDFAWDHKQWERFGSRAQVRINVIPSIPDRGNCADVEPKAFRPDSNLTRWYDARRGAGVLAAHLSVYTDWDDFPGVIQVMGGREYHVWIASPDHVGPFHGISGRQATGANKGYDESQVWDKGWLA